MGRSKILFFKFFAHMCRSKMAVDAVEPEPKYPPSQTSSTTEHTEPLRSSTTSSDSFLSSPSDLSTTNTPPPPAVILSSISDPASTTTTTTNVSIPNYTSTSYCDSSTTSISIMSPKSLSSLRDSLSERPYIYDLYEISVATNNFLAKKYTSSSSADPWQCKLRGKEVLVFQRMLQKSMDNSQLREMLSLICRSNHTSVIKLLGASISGDSIYLVYEFIDGINLANCLRNPSNTVLSTWVSRMLAARDIAHGLDYIHSNTGENILLVHKHITSSSILITEPPCSAKICHLGRAQLCAETDENMLLLNPSPIREDHGETAEMTQFESMYMAPEFQSTGVATQKSDVYAFGLLVLELFGESLKCELDEESGDLRRTLMIETARKVIEGGRGDGSGGGGREGRLRLWVDRRLNDSFPVLVAEKLTCLALECVLEDPDKRPDMRRVARTISQLYLESGKWWDGVRRVKETSGIAGSKFPRRVIKTGFGNL